MIDMRSSVHRIDDYLSGTRFDENLVVAYDKGPVIHRAELLRAACRGKSVLHVGCCDHVPLIQSKIAAGEWLHAQLMEAANKVVGVDIDAKAVEYTRNIAGVTNIFAGDITSSEPIQEIVSSHFDYAIFGEVLEHIGNPVSFLDSFRNKYGGNFSKIIVTVPNAFRAGNLRGIFRNQEIINSDHRFFFTPYTLAKVLFDAGFRAERIAMAMFSRKGRLQRAILNRWPLLAETIVLFGASCGGQS